MRRRGSVLVGLLWCLALVTVVVISALHSSHMEMRVAKNHGDLIQAHYLALAGIEKAKALLHQDAADRKRAGVNHSGTVFNSPNDFREIKLGRGMFSVFRAGTRDEGGRIVYGISDEESRLNINHAERNELSKLYRMQPEVISAILDWRDGDNNANPEGAEADYYATLPVPSLPRNDRFKTVRELLMVRGITPDLFAGEDANMNGLLDPEEDDGESNSPVDNHDGILDGGWLGEITVDSWVANKSAKGEDRINLQSADERTLTTVPGITAEIAKAIVNSRGQNQLENLADLLDVTGSNPQQPRTPAPQGSSTATPTPSGNTQGGGSSTATTTRSAASGPKVISEELLMEIADDVTALQGSEQPGAVNINTASADVLQCLPGITEDIANAIITYRKSSGYFPNTAHLLKVDGVTREIFKQVAPKISARSETFRIVSEGRIPSTGARKRVQMIIRAGSYGFDTISYREDL